MEDNKKTKIQLVEELSILNHKIKKLEKSEAKRKQAEEAIQDTLEYAENIVETIRKPLVVLNSDLKILSANSSFYDTFKVAPEETLGNFIYYLGNRQWDIPKLRVLLEDILPSNTVFNGYEVEHDFPNIGHKVILLNARQIFRKNIGSNIILLVMEDITEHKRLEDLLTDSEERFRRLFETASDGIVLLEKREGKITHTNPAAEKMFGYTKEECIGKKLQDIGVLLDMGDFQTKMQILDENGIINYNNVPVKTKSGQHIDTDIYLVDRAKLAQCNIRDITNRKKEEEKVREITRRLQLATSSAKAGVWDWNLQTNDMIWDDRMLELYGLTQENFPGGIEAWEQGLHPDDSSRAIEECQAALRGERDFDTEFRVLHPDGTVVHIQANGIVLHDDEGKPLRMIGLNTDITERKHTEDDLRKSEEKYRLLIDTANESIIVAQDGLLKFVNPMTLSLLGGYSEQELIDRPFPELIHPDDRSMVVENYRRRIANKGVQPQYAFRILTRDCIVKWVEINATFIEWEGKSATLNFLTDITGRKQAEESLRESEEKYRIMVETTQDLIYTTDSKGFLTYMNPTLEVTLGYTHNEWNGKAFTQIVSPEYIDLVRGNFKRAMKGESIHIYSVDMVRKDGTRLSVEFNTTTLNDSEGNFKGSYGVGRDITDRKRAEEEKKLLEERLNRAEKMESLGLLAGGVAHDLNNVLGIIVGYAELALGNMDKFSSLKSHLETVMSGGMKAAAIVDDLLTLARRGVSDRNVINLNKIIADCQQSPEMEKLYSYHPSVMIKTNIEPDLLNISGSSVHLGKSLYNLISNAAESMPKGGCVTIKTTNQYLDKPIHGYDKIQVGYYVVLSVSDTGEGISSDNLKRIFEPFYTKKIMGRSGTGLGLSVVWGTVKDHNGYIDVESEVGKGSTFILYFPVMREDIPAKAVAVEVSEYVGKSESILIVDDVREQRDLAAGMLRTLNYSVTSVSSGEEAVEYLKKNKADIIVLDMIMDPGMDGLDTYKSILKINPRQKTIIVSGFSESERVKTAKALGAGSYLRKPYIQEKLGLAVRKELDKTT